ncbi:sugar ABC transporter permease [Sphingomonas naphthae]|uniref:Sugar ABC transporter permease n=1 Tax=Sphingomonas naphthae TaxID=1813468 RepID=A0ABY7TIP8_9SPHN|nr:sugar ABC transporter permease [Sphingomonas naphthae]WCT73083.1 sugar ABC transporter permease [Sphingomonas naphthae]
MRREGGYSAGPGLILVPAILLVLLTYYGSILWTIYISFTDSNLIPNYRLVGIGHYIRLWSMDRWHTSVANMLIFGSGYIVLTLLLGGTLAILLDRQARGESIFRTIYLYPLSMSFIVTGVVWQWLLNPSTGVQQFVRDLGWQSFTFDWIGRPDRAIYTLVFAGVWHASGYVMAILLAGLRGIDPEIWRAARIEGIPVWRVYASVVLPSMRATVATCVVLLVTHVVKAYDLVIAMTRGGPGTSTDLPAKFVVDAMFERGNVALGSAAAVMLLLIVAAALVPFYLYQRRQPK